MRPSTPLLLSALLAIAPNARAQSVAAPSVPTQPAAAPTQAPATSARQPKAARHSHKQQATGVAETAHAGAPKGPPAGVDLGATDITGNKELPKVMVIVPWKDSLGAGGVIKPTDSLLDDVLQPVDRGVFQRQIRYYGQLDGPAARVAPVGDSH
ncbi:MAG TPA: hypothetical protein VMA54_14825 [Steroidobacteraceae bacterium]|nr:hypothetical protein [Steroidobacteraceae bacterium]